MKKNGRPKNRAQKIKSNQFTEKDERSSAEVADLTDMRCQFCGDFLFSDEFEMLEDRCTYCESRLRKVFDPDE
jgi:hypothetical protein